MNKKWPPWVKQRLAVHGAPVGILMNDRMPGTIIRPYLPGDTGNACTWSVPVRYKTVPGLNARKILGPDAGEMTEAVIEAARELVREGAQLVTCGCGYWIRYHKAVRDAVDVPVFLSSLLLAPFLEAMLPPHKALGVMVASKASMTPELLEAAGLQADIGRRVVIAGLEDTPAFAATWLRSEMDLDVTACGADVIEAAVTLVKERPDIGMLLLECGDLPPYAAAVQQAIQVPVYDYTSMIEFFIRGLIRRPFTGLI